MKKRKDGFLSPENIDHNGEIMDYIRELHEYLWEYVRCVLPSASGKLDDYIDIVLQELKHKNRAKNMNEEIPYDSVIRENQGAIEREEQEEQERHQD